MQKNTGITRLVKATSYSIQGFKAGLKTEAALRQELAALIILIPLALLLPVTPLEKVLLIVSLLLVILVELINSAIEAVVDRISSEQHELSGKAKDLGSAAVLIALIISGIMWLVICWPIFINLIAD